MSPLDYVVIVGTLLALALAAGLISFLDWLAARAYRQELEYWQKFAAEERLKIARRAKKWMS